MLALACSPQVRGSHSWIGTGLTAANARRLGELIQQAQYAEEAMHRGGEP